jgi:hypothetical protein
MAHVCHVAAAVRGQLVQRQLSRGQSGEPSKLGEFGGLMQSRVMAKGAKARAGKPNARDGLVATLQARFAAHPQRHHGISWDDVETLLDAEVLPKLAAMEESGGEPDVVRMGGSGEIAFVDCATESPTGRRSLCYDREAWQSRKEARPANNVLDVAAEMGVELLTEAEYRALQTLGELDTKTSSWLETPRAIRALGGALFGDRRYEHVFVYHNGAQSYYAARGFRAKLRIGALRR